MSHYFCKADGCRTISDSPSICLEPRCFNRYKLLDECDCSHRGRHTRQEVNLSYHAPGHHNLNVFHFGLALGTTVGAYTFLVGILAMATGWGTELVAVLSTWYVGYNGTLVGSIAGGIWAFLDGFVGGVFISWIYNFFQRKRLR